MKNIHSNAEVDLGKLRMFADDLILLVNNILKQIPYSEEDHLAFMSLCFVCKQVDHLKSICVLIDSGHHRDAALIARSMMEGMCLLLWAAKEPSTRPLRWRSYALVEDFKLIKKKEKDGEEIDPKYRSEIERRLIEYGPQFYKKKAREAQNRNLPLPEDPYNSKWIEANVKDIFNEVEGSILYEQIYNETSKWIHWTIGGLGTAICRKDETVVYSGKSKDIACMALASGFQSLIESAALLDMHLSLASKENLLKLREHYLEAFEQEAE